MKQKETTIELIRESEMTALYSISFEKDGTTEFEKFVQTFERDAELNTDYHRIIAALRAILDQGALERFFRPEGRLNDHVGALPLEGGRLRLYCLRISQQIIILGNGGIKTTRTYDEDRKLLGYVMDLQRFEKILNEEIRRGSIRIEEKMLYGIDDIKLRI